MHEEKITNISRLVKLIQSYFDAQEDDIATLKNQFTDLSNVVNNLMEVKNEAFRSINIQGSPSKNSTSLGISPMP